LNARVTGDDKMGRRWNEAVITQSRIKPTFNNRDKEKPQKNSVRTDCVPQDTNWTTSHYRSSMLSPKKPVQQHSFPLKQ